MKNEETVCGAACAISRFLIHHSAFIIFISNSHFGGVTLPAA